jgi:hypothetical protein
MKVPKMMKVGMFENSSGLIPQMVTQKERWRIDIWEGWQQ